MWNQQCLSKISGRISSALFLLLLQFLCGGIRGALAEIVDVVAIVVDRSTLYPNGLHNGLWLGAELFNLTLEIRTVGDFDPEISQSVLQQAIDTPSEQQPKMYLIWPIDLEGKLLMQQLHQKHPSVPILQLNQLPNQDFEFETIVGYAGPDDALRARNAAQLLRQGLLELNPQEQEFNVVGMGYPESYAGYHLSMNAFADGIQQDNEQTNNTTATTSRTTLNLLQRLPLNWGTQHAYETTLNLFQQQYAAAKGRHANRARGKRKRRVLHGIYAMDDNILLGVYQALKDLRIEAGSDVLVVGTVCNGARSLLESKQQYGTTVQSPLLEGKLALHMAHEYLTTTATTTTGESWIQFTPNPPATSTTWDAMFIDFLGQRYTSDGLCTWDLFYQREAGPTHVESVNDFCEIATCEYIPRGLFLVGYVLVGTNYGISAAVLALLYVYRRKETIRVAQPFFLALVVLGSMVDTTSILFMSRDNRDYSQEQLNAACLTWPTLLSVGHMMTTATLAAKIYRVKRLVDAGLNFRRVKVSAAQVSLFIVLFVALDAVVLLVWFTSDPFHWTLRTSSTDLSGYVNEAFGECSSDGDNYWVFPVVIGFLHISVLLYANYLAYKTARYHAISDAKSVAICLFNSIQLILIGAPILALVGDNIATSYLIRICFVFLNNFGVLVIIVCPKIYQSVWRNGSQGFNIHVSGAQENDPNTSSYAKHLPETSLPYDENSTEMGITNNSHSGLRSRYAKAGSGSSIAAKDQDVVSRVIEEGDEDPSVELPTVGTGSTNENQN